MATFSARVTASGDDGYHDGSSLDNSATNEAWGDGGTPIYSSFYRILNVTIPRNSTILTAKLTGQASASRTTTTCNINIYGEAADNPAAPTTVGDYNGRALTSAVAWNAVAAMTINLDYDSPDITAIVQAIVSRGGWSSGNAMQFFFKNNASSDTAFRQWKTYDSSAGVAVLLTVTYTPVDTGFFF